MIKCIAVFRSKTDLFTFINALKYSGAIVETVATPKEAHIGCGLSAKFDERYFSLALRILKHGGFDGFYGIYKVKRVDGRVSTFRAYP